MYISNTYLDENLCDIRMNGAVHLHILPIKYIFFFPVNIVTDGLEKKTRLPDG